MPSSLRYINILVAGSIFSISRVITSYHVSLICNTVSNNQVPYSPSSLNCGMKIPPLRGIDGQIVNSNQKQLIWPSIPHGGVTLLTNQLEMISRGPPNCSITKSLLHVV